MQRSPSAAADVRQVLQGLRGWPQTDFLLREMLPVMGLAPDRVEAIVANLKRCYDAVPDPENNVCFLELMRVTGELEALKSMLPAVQE